jgi:hypothetical protein
MSLRRSGTLVVLTVGLLASAPAAQVPVRPGPPSNLMNTPVVCPGVIQGDFLLTNALDGGCALVPCTSTRVRCDGRGRVQITIAPVDSQPSSRPMSLRRRNR